MIKRIALLAITLVVALLLALPFIYWSFQSHPGVRWPELWNLNHGLFLEILLSMLAALMLEGLGKAGAWMARLLAFLVPLVLTVQFMHLYFAGSPFGEVTLDHADQFSLVLGSRSLELSLLCPLGVFLFLLWLRLSRRQGRARLPFFLLLMAIAVAIPPHLMSQRFSVGRDARDYHWPAIELFQVLFHYYVHPVVQTEAGEVDLRLARAFGFDFLALAGSKPRQQAYRTPFPYPRRKPAKERPNVIVFFVESLSARMIGAYGMRKGSVTPNLDEFALGALRVEGYVNHTTPTVPGLFGQLCSVYPPYKAEMKSLPADVSMECLPHILSRDLGYRTIYFTHSSPKYAGIGKLLRKWGFQETHLWRGLLKEYVGGEPPYLGEGGLSDHQMMRGLVNYLESNRERLLGSQPFFIGLSTVETHTGRTPNHQDGVRPPHPVSDVDDAFFNMDDAFGRFWRYFRDSPYADNTIVIVTADHARFPSLDYHAVAGGNYQFSVFDQVALLIRDPFHALPGVLKLRASTLDFAPSMYHLVGGDSRRSNYFMGLSIFGDRQQTEGAVSLSAYSEFGYLVSDRSGVRLRKSFDCDKETDALCDHDRRLLIIVRHLQDLVREKRYWGPGSPMP